ETEATQCPSGDSDGEWLSNWLARNGCAVRGPCSDNVWIERTGPPPPDRNSSVRPSGVTSPAHWSSGATSSNSAGPEPSAGIQDKSPWPNWPREYTMRLPSGVQIGRWADWSKVRRVRVCCGLAYTHTRSEEGRGGKDGGSE